MSLSQILSRLGAPKAQGAESMTQNSMNQGPTAQNSMNQEPTNKEPAAPSPAAPNQQLSLNDFAVAFQRAENNNKEQPAPESFYPDFLSEEFRTKLRDNVKFDNIFTDNIFHSLQSGNPQEFRNAMNTAMQTLMLYTFSGLGKLTEEGVNKRFQGLDKMLETKLSRSNVESALNSHPILSNPALNPVREALTESFTSKYPQATQQDIKAFVDEYLLTLAKTVNPADGADKKKNAAPATDWANFL